MLLKCRYYQELRSLSLFMTACLFVGEEMTVSELVCSSLSFCRYFFIYIQKHSFLSLKSNKQFVKRSPMLAQASAGFGSLSFSSEVKTVVRLNWCFGVTLQNGLHSWRNKHFELLFFSLSCVLERLASIRRVRRHVLSRAQSDIPGHHGN
ncbi:hypothetical protein AAFF_G00248730 [Aldrovandia affinis]|uniref:Uncharacterized protein n=1 Tax=Aldrovandia affinis TaxID=143900 RepID=A0AAD7RDR4_9TELE|nr:hypothetical protein AAFF_G00248730 [Aldrovandia affinis]